MFFAHGPLSYIVNEKIQKRNISKLSTHEQTVVMILSILFGILPDIDLLLLSMTAIPSFQHRLLFTHSILFYIICWLLLNLFFFLLKKLLNKNGKKALNDGLLNVIQLSFLIGTMTHLLSDILFSHSVILFPLQRQFTILGEVFKTSFFTSYPFTPLSAVELVITSLFLITVQRKYLKNIKLIKYPLYLLLILTILYTPFTMYMNMQTYNMSRHFKNGISIEDQEYDGIKDSADPDTNSNWVNNIFDIERGELARFTQSISTGKYLASHSLDTLNYRFGAFDSYRLISQAYFEQNSAIEPVLIGYYKSKYNINSYSIDVLYPTLLYEYMSDMGLQKDINFENDIGKIFFVKDTDETVLNMGIILEQRMFGIVLEGDERLTIHNEIDILSKYPNCVITITEYP